MQIWNYDQVTGELTGVSVADESPLEPGVFLLPAHATETAPPNVPAGMAAVFRNGAWSLVEDHRGETWWTTHDASYVVTDLGVPTGSAVRPEAPPPTQADLLAYAADKRWRVETGGFVSSTGIPIATDRDSQAKLLAELVAIGAGMRADPSPWKRRDGQFALLTNAQMAAIIGEARAHIAAAFGVEEQVGAAIAVGTITTVAQIDAAAWPLNG